MGQALNIAKAVEKGSIVLVLVLVILGVGWLYIQERRKNEALNQVILDNSKEMITALLGVQTAVSTFKETLEVVRTYMMTQRTAPPPKGGDS